MFTFVRMQSVQVLEQLIGATVKVRKRRKDRSVKTFGRIEDAGRSAIFRRAKTFIGRIRYGIGENIFRRLVPPSWNAAQDVHLGIVVQRKFATKCFHKNFERLLFVHEVRWKLGAIGAIDPIAFVRIPIVHPVAAVERVDDR